MPKKSAPILPNKRTSLNDKLLVVQQFFLCDVFFVLYQDVRQLQQQGNDSAKQSKQESPKEVCFCKLRHKHTKTNPNTK